MPMLHSKLEVVGITFTHECSNSSPRYMRENHYAILVCNCEISYVSNSQDKHNASFLNVLWKDLYLSECKNKKNLITVKILMTKFTEK